MLRKVTPPVVLLTDPAGTIHHASAGAEACLGPTEGRCCRFVVGATTEDDEPVCTATCMYEEPRSPTRVRVHDKPYRMTCAEAGDQRVVMLEPLVEGGGGWVSPRELEVLALVSQGLTNARIARRLILSTFTVRTHVEHLLEKLHVRTRTAAVARAMQLGILPG
jgi:DNA-binding CsgD family transcriptional regulator